MPATYPYRSSWAVARGVRSDGPSPRAQASGHFATPTANPNPNPDRNPNPNQVSGHSCVHQRVSIGAGAFL